MRNLWRYVQGTWCYFMHPAPMWPVNGHYRCPECQRMYPVPWEQAATRWTFQPQPARRTNRYSDGYVPNANPEVAVSYFRPIKPPVNAN